MRGRWSVVVGCILLTVGCGGTRRAAYDPSVQPHNRGRVVRIDGGKPVDVQPDPADPFARDTRADALLGAIALESASVRRELYDASAAKNAGLARTLTARLTAFDVVEREARAVRADLRTAAIEDPAASEELWTKLTELRARAHRIANGTDRGFQPVVGAAMGVELASMRSTAASSRDVLSVLGLGGRAAGASKQHAPQALPAGPAPQPTQAAAPPSTRPAASPFHREGAHDASMLLRSAQLTLGVFEVEKKLTAVEAIAIELGGYLALRGDREITIRVPRERFDEGLKSIEKLGDVLHRTVAAEDVTDQFVDLELRLRNAQAVRTRLEKLLETASVRDAVEIQKELAKVTEEIERFEGKLKLLRDRIAFSTITVTFERTEPERVKTKALLPFPWMTTMGLGPLLQVPR